MAFSAEQSDAYVRISQFLGYEAMLLDENRLNEWVELMDEAIIYEIPLRLSVERGANGEYPPGAFRQRDDKEMLKKRLERIVSGEGWAEEPPSRTVRNIGSVAIEQGGEKGQFLVHSATHVFRQRGQDRVSDTICARRKDIIKITDAGCILVKRTVFLGETILQTPNLGIFL